MCVNRVVVVALTASLALVVFGRAANAVEYGNLSCSPGSYELWAGESTSGFHVDSLNSTTGSYKIQIGGAFWDDYTGGVLIPSVANNLRDNGSGPLVYTANVEMAKDGSNQLTGQYVIKTAVAQTVALGDVDVSAAYFPFSEGWVMGYTSRVDGALTGTMDKLTASPGLALGTNVFDDGSGGTQLYLPGVNSITDGVLLAVNQGGISTTPIQNFAMVQSNDDGSFHIYNHPNNQDADDYRTNPVGFVFVPHGTPGIVTGVATSRGGVVAGSGFSVKETADGKTMLTIDGYSPTEGTLIVNVVGGRGSTDDNMITYQMNELGTGYEINLRDLDDVPTNQPTLTTGSSLRNISFAFLPFNQQATAPGAIQPRVDHTAQVSAANLLVTELDPSANYADNTLVQIAQSTAGITTTGSNAADYGIIIGGNYARVQDGVMLATVREDYRTNPQSLRNGVAWVSGNAYAGGSPDSAGWEIATQLADAQYGGEMNVNVATSYFPFKQGWAAGTAEPGENSTGQDVLTVNAPGVDTRTAGLLFVNSFGNGPNTYTAAAPTAGGDGWNVTIYDGMGLPSTDVTSCYNYVYLPYGDTQNVTMGQVNSAGALGTHQGTVTVTKEVGQTGVYRLQFSGNTPDDSMLLLTSPANAFLVYEKDGNDFLVHAYQGSANPGAPEAQAIDAAFNFALVDFDSAPALSSSAVNPLRGTIGAASWQITAQDGDNAAPLITRVGTSDPKFDLYPDNSTSRGDLRVKYGNGRLMPSKGVLFAQVCENYRDNTGVLAFPNDTDPATRYGIASWGIAATNLDENGMLITTSDSDPLNAHDEYDVNVAAAFFPYNSGFQVGYTSINDGKIQLRLPGSGDSRRDGVLLVTSAANGDDFATAGPTADGQGWTVFNRDNNADGQGGDFGYAYLPYGTQNLVAGHISSDGGRFSWCGDFHIEQIPAEAGSRVKGKYRLTIKGVTPADGILLLSATDADYSGDNLLTYAADGDGFVINGLDANDDRAAALDNTEFHFAFIPYDGSLGNAQLRAAHDPTRCSALNLSVTRNTTDTADNSAQGVTAYEPYDPVTFARQATDRFACLKSGRGDYDMALDGVKTMASDGIMMATVRNNSRNNGDANGTRWGVATSGDGTTAWAAVCTMDSGAEFDCDVAAAFFRYDGKWAGGYASDAGVLTNLGLGDYTLTRPGTGEYVLSIDGANANTNGLLFALAANNGNEVASVGARPDGSWDVRLFEGNNGTAKNSNFTFLYLPMGTFEGYTVDGLLGGQIEANGDVVTSLKKGDFALSHESAGTYRLSIADETPESGMLLLTAIGLADNVFSYEADGDDFLIMSNDLGNGIAGLLEDCGFNFAFIGFDDPMQVVESTVRMPGDADGDNDVDADDARFLATNWGTTEGATWEMGDFNDDGKVNAADASILAANWTGSLSAESQSVPEPSGLVLLLSLAGALSWRGGRK